MSGIYFTVCGRRFSSLDNAEREAATIAKRIGSRVYVFARSGRFFWVERTANEKGKLS